MGNAGVTVDNRISSSFVERAMIIAATPQHYVQTIAFNEVGRTSIMGDPNWKNGDCDKSSRPEMGLAVARTDGTYNLSLHREYVSKIWSGSNGYIQFGK